MIVKICGMRTEEAARAAEAAGADLLGFIFYQGSHRYVAPETVKQISTQVRRSKRVGVFVDAPLAEVNEIAEFCSLDYVQLHGHEDAAYARQVARPVIKAYRYGDNFLAEEAEHYPAEMILLDSFVQGAAGGTGKTFAWQEASRETASLSKPLLVAGGISEHNLSQVVEAFHPYGVDVSGSLEEQGEKSVSLIEAFFKEAERWRS
ncbi:MAG: phosphoribosylanthranilate isomerase [Selenomonas ruminantium]|nr:phosphoribosylanthranilate isomerase [Selenomonas ruminantium]